METKKMCCAECDWFIKCKNCKCHTPEKEGCQRCPDNDGCKNFSGCGCPCHQEPQLEDIKGGECSKCGIWKGGSYGMNGGGKQTYHECQEPQPEKCKECNHGLCKAGSHCHNADCEAVFTPTKSCWDTLLPKKEPQSWQEKFDERFIYDFFDNTGLQILGERVNNCPVDDGVIKGFISQTLESEKLRVVGVANSLKVRNSAEMVGDERFTNGYNQGLKDIINKI